MADTSLTRESFPTSLCLGVTSEGEEARLSNQDTLKHLVVLGRSGCKKKKSSSGASLSAACLAQQLYSLIVQRPAQLAATNEDRGAEATDQKQRERLEWFSTWEEE